MLLLCEAQKCTCVWLWCHISAFTKAARLTSLLGILGLQDTWELKPGKCSVCFNSHSDHKVERGTDDSSQCSSLVFAERHCRHNHLDFFHGFIAFCFDSCSCSVLICSFYELGIIQELEFYLPCVPANSPDVLCCLYCWITFSCRLETS